MLADVLQCYGGHDFRYTYGRDVTGSMNVNMQVHGIGYYKNFASNKTNKVMQVCSCFSECFLEAALLTLPALYRLTLRLLE